MARSMTMRLIDDRMLKPCPFCGGRATLELVEVDEAFTFTDLYYTVICTKCGLRKGRYGIPKFPEFCEAEDTDAKMTAVAEWNRREEHSGGVYTDGYIEQSPSAQPDIIRCRDCKYCEHWYADKGRCFLWHEGGIDVFKDGFCNYAERRTDETD